MADQRQDLYERIVSVEEKVDSLTASIDQRFEEVTESFVEQRRYTDFAFDRLNASLSTLEAKMDSGFARLDRKLDQLIDRA